MIAFYLNGARLRMKLFILSIGMFCCINQAAFALNLATSQIILAVQTPAIKSVSSNNQSFSGNISWYGIPFNGKKTASGEIFDMNKLTAAHLKLPFGTRVLVEDPKTGNTVIVKVNDRGPYVKTRVMDLAKEGARELGTLGRGVAFVDCLIISEEKN